MTDVLHYRGNHLRFDPRLIYGPDDFNGHYRAVEAEYDAEYDYKDGTPKGRTTITLKIVPPEELAEMAKKIFASGKPLWEGYRRE